MSLVGKLESCFLAFLHLRRNCEGCFLVAFPLRKELQCFWGGLWSPGLCGGVLVTPPGATTPIHVHNDQRDPVVVYWPSGFLEAWGTKAKKPQISRNILLAWPCRRRRQGKKNTIFIENCVFCCLGTPGLQKNTWPINHFGIPLTRVWGHGCFQTL